MTEESSRDTIGLKVIGWGPFSWPGEKSRRRRLADVVHKALERPLPTSETDQGGRPPASSTMVSPPATTAGPTLSAKLGDRKLYFEDQEGPDVEDLQRRLVRFGFLAHEKVTRIYDADTKEALRDFQHTFGIYVDGVAGTVTAKVLRYLAMINYDPDKMPISDDFLTLVRSIARGQQLGIVLIGTKVDDNGKSTGTRASLAKEIVDRLAKAIADDVDAQPTLQAAITPPQYSVERGARLADSIHAEFVIYIEVLDDPNIGPGTATHHFATANSQSAIGYPLARCINAQIAKASVLPNRGESGEDSELLQRPTAPTVRVAFGNIHHEDDLAVLKDQGHVHRLARAVRLGISQLYDLDLPQGSQPLDVAT